MDDRDSVIIRVSVIAVIGNVALAVLKGFVGIATHSIAIALDGVNSLVDGMSSVVAIIGTKLAKRPATHTHPFGYGRSEYLASVLIATLILVTGVVAFVESVKSIMNPEAPEYTTVSLVIVAIAAAVKGLLAVFLLRTGKKVKSGSLIGSGTDSMMDAFVSVATFVAAIVYITTGISTESWLAAGISILIVKSGIQLLLNTVSKIHGERVDPKIVSKVEQTARSVEEVRLASGLLLQDYGPNMIVGSIHLTVDGDMTVAEFDSVAREVQERVHEECGVILSGVTPYAAAGDDKDVKKVRGKVARIVWGNDAVVELRGLYVDTSANTVRFDAIVAFGSGDWMEIQKEITEECKKACPDWEFDVRVIPHAGD